MQHSSVLSLVFFTSVICVVRAQTLNLGSCPTVTVKKDFNLTQVFCTLKNRWHDASLSSVCRHLVWVHEKSTLLHDYGLRVSLRHGNVHVHRQRHDQHRKQGEQSAVRCRRFAQFVLIFITFRICLEADGLTLPRERERWCHLGSLNSRSTISLVIQCSVLLFSSLLKVYLQSLHAMYLIGCWTRTTRIIRSCGAAAKEGGWTLVRHKSHRFNAKLIRSLAQK